MIRIDPDSIIYVLCPSHIVTGGIEAVHQLVDKLREFGHDARIVPQPNVSNPTLLQYRSYDATFSSYIEDDSRNILITTEVNPRALDPYHSIRKALWWLSVDNHEKQVNRFDFADPANERVCHFVQSAYAEAFLRQRGITTIHYLSDYLHEEYLRTGKWEKNDVVLYTPVKGSDDYVQQLIAADPTIQWLPLKGMIRKKHAATLRAGKVYVDFGSHPGKDRQPREAVVNGCCVVAGLRGSACFAEDLPIAASYKFALDPMDPASVLATIKSCLSEYSRRIREFDHYRTVVRQEPTQFGREVAAIFGIKRRRHKPDSLTILEQTLAFIRENNALVVARGLANEFLPLSCTESAKRIYHRLRS